MCGTYISGWNYWNAEFYNEFVRTGGEDSAYLEYAAHRVNVYYDLVIQKPLLTRAAAHPLRGAPGQERGQPIVA